MNKVSKSRRKFLAGTGGLVALSSMPGYLSASQIKSSEGIAIQQKSVVLYREEETSSVEFAEVFASAGMTAIALQDDIVRQWRDGLGETLKEHSAFGLSNWTDYFMVRALAVEDRRFPIVEKRHVVNASTESEWAIEHAIELLQKSTQDSIESLRYQNVKGAELNSLSQHKDKSLFSWVVA